MPSQRQRSLCSKNLDRLIRFAPILVLNETCLRKLISVKLASRMLDRWISIAGST
jgi:hypothetical protein